MADTHSHVSGNSFLICPTGTDGLPPPPVRKKLPDAIAIGRPFPQLVLSDTTASEITYKLLLLSFIR